MPIDPTAVFKSSREQAESVAADALAGVPADGDARAEWFLSWRNRTLDALGSAFHEGAGPVERFRDIEFTPRRLTGDPDRDDRLRHDTFKAGCAASRALFHRLIERIRSVPDAITEPSPAVELAKVVSPPTDAAPGSKRLTFGPAEPCETGFMMTEQEQENQKESPMPLPMPAPMTERTAKLSHSVSKGFVRCLSHDHPKDDASTVAAAKLLTDLTLLCEDPAFRATFASLASAAGESETPSAPDPTLLWCAALAISRMRPAA